jgi:hypothetical protein
MTLIQTTINPHEEGYNANNHLRKKHKTSAKRSSKSYGVVWNSRQNAWHSYVYYNNKRKHLGRFEPTDEGERLAALAYDKMAVALGLPTNILKPLTSITAQR